MLPVGIDYGSKLAGTTAFAFREANGEISISSSLKNKDADLFIRDLINSKTGRLAVFLDAPLSLPGVYRSLKGFSNYFYRQCDQEVKAMSPMFLGGLTARAMHLKSQMSSKETSFYEAYPKLMASKLGLMEMGYKKNTASLEKNIAVLRRQLLVFREQPATWHEIDATLALLIGENFLKGKAEIFGDESEGLIYG